MEGDLSANSLYVLEQLHMCDALETMKGDISIRVNKGLRKISGFDQLKKIEGDLDISHNTHLDSLYGFDELHTIKGRLALSKNVHLTEINNFNALKTLHSLSLFGNDKLMTAPSLQSIDPNTVTKVRIKNNLAFSPCAFSFLCQISNKEGMTIEDNLATCTDLEAVENSCN